MRFSDEIDASEIIIEVTGIRSLNTRGAKTLLRYQTHNRKAGAAKRQHARIGRHIRRERRRFNADYTPPQPISRELPPEVIRKSPQMPIIVLPLYDLLAPLLEKMRADDATC